MAALIEGTGTTKAQSYKMSVERNAVLTGQNKSSLLVPSGELSLEEARDLLDSIIQELPLHAATLTEIKAEYEKKVESLPSPSGKDEPADNKSEELTEYEFLQEYTQEIKDLEKQIASVSAENAKLRAQISDQEEVCDKISMSMYDSSSIQQSTTGGEEKDKYISKVHDLQAKIAHLKQSTQSVREESSQMSLIAECRPLEQCLKEAEVRNLRARKKNEELKVMLQDLHGQLTEMSLLKSLNFATSVWEKGGH